MAIRLYRAEDAADVAALSAACARSEAEFVLNPMWETEEELWAEFARHGVAPEDHLLVYETEEERVRGLSGFLGRYGADAAGLFCPVVAREERGRGTGGELLRAALEHGRQKLGVRLATAGIGTRNRAGYALLTAHGFRPVRQHFLMRCDKRPARGRVAAARGLELGLAEAADLPAIHEIYRACGLEERTEQRLADLFADGRHVHAVARDGGKVVAFAEIETHWPRRNWIAFVGVAPALRDRGVGSALVAWAVTRQMEAGAREALLLLSPANRTALRAYEKVGFRRHRVFDVLEKILD
jgi:ribosomal protein S18 acetylase RimI-like enzyme